MTFPRSHSLHLIISLAAAVLLSGCIPASPVLTPAVQPTAAPQVVIQGENPSKEELQTIEIDNCNGKTDIPRIETRSQSIETTISADLAAKLGASGAVIYGEVQATVGAALGRKAERTSSIQVAAPPGSRMVFQLAWTGPEQLGFVQNLRGSNLPVAFTVFTPTDVRIKNQIDIGCPTSIASSQVEIVGTRAAVAQQTPVTSASAGKYPCSLVIRQSEVESQRLGQVSVPVVHAALRWFDSKRPQNEGTFARGTKIPSGVLVATNFDEQDGSKWTQYPVTPIVHSGSWGLFQSTGEYSAPNAGACLTIVP